MRVITVWFTLLSSATRMESVGAATPADASSWNEETAAPLTAVPRASPNAWNSASSSLVGRIGLMSHVIPASVPAGDAG